MLLAVVHLVSVLVKSLQTKCKKAINGLGFEALASKFTYSHQTLW